MNLILLSTLNDFLLRNLFFYDILLLCNYLLDLFSELHLRSRQFWVLFVAGGQQLFKMFVLRLRLQTIAFFGDYITYPHFLKPLNFFLHFTRRSLNLKLFKLFVAFFLPLLNLLQLNLRLLYLLKLLAFLRRQLLVSGDSRHLIVIKIFLDQIQSLAIIMSNNNYIAKFAAYGIESDTMLKVANFSSFESTPFVLECYLLAFYELLIISFHIHAEDIQTPLVVKVFFRLNPEMVDLLWDWELNDLVFFYFIQGRLVFGDYLQILVKEAVLFQKQR